AQRAGVGASRPSHPEDLHLAPVGRGEPLEDFDGGGLPRPVWPQQAEALARVDGEIETGDRDDIGVSLDQPGTVDWRREQGQAGVFGSGGVVACFIATSSCMKRLLTASPSARIFMLIPPPRLAMTDLVPATSAMVPTFAVSARCRIWDASLAIF